MKQIFKFETNINCSGCVAKAKPVLDTTEGIEQWNVDIGNPKKILTIEGEGILKEKVISAVEKAGFKIDLYQEK